MEGLICQVPVYFANVEGTTKLLPDKILVVQKCSFDKNCPFPYIRSEVHLFVAGCLEA